jgi:hypothetical protein
VRDVRLLLEPKTRSAQLSQARSCEATAGAISPGRTYTDDSYAESPPTRRQFNRVAVDHAIHRAERRNGPSLRQCHGRTDAAQYHEHHEEQSLLGDLRTPYRARRSVPSRIGIASNRSHRSHNVFTPRFAFVRSWRSPIEACGSNRGRSSVGALSQPDPNASLLMSSLSTQPR